MSIKFENPKGYPERFVLALELNAEFNKFSLHLSPDQRNGGIGSQWIAFEVKHFETQADMGFLQIFFGPEGWVVLAPQNDQGKQSLEVLAQAINRDPKQINLLKVARPEIISLTQNIPEVPMFRVDFPYDSATVAPKLQ